MGMTPMRQRLIRLFGLLLGLTLGAGWLAADSVSSERWPPSQSRFLWGLGQAYEGPRGDVFPLSRQERQKLRDELHINALRFWVHPAWVGLPQKAFNGPEAIDYTQFQEEDYVWRDPSPALDSLDEALDLLYELDIHPLLMVWPVNEYVQ